MIVLALLMAATKLPDVKFTSSKTLYQALQNRKSTRSYKADAPISSQDLSELLWAATGVNRKAGGYTVAAARGNLNVTVYAILTEGIYQYQPKDHSLREVVKGDFRNLAGSQEFARTAPLNIVMVGEFDDDGAKLYAGMHAGSISQNIYLVASDKNLATVVRAFVDKDALGKALKLKKNQEVLLVQSVGHFE